MYFLRHQIEWAIVAPLHVFFARMILRHTIILSCILALSGTARTSAAPPPASTSDQFCVWVQHELASTKLNGKITLFTDMPSYRHSKPMVRPLEIFQVVTYAEKMPVVVSCKVKTAAHLRDEYSADAAGEQKFCHHVVELLKQQAADELTAVGNTEAAARATAFVIDRDEPYITGREYLADFRTLYPGADGAVHIAAPGLYQDYERWYTMFLPEIVQGQSYCHLATVEAIKAVATGEMKAAVVYHTRDDAPTTPQ